MNRLIIGFFLVQVVFDLAHSVTAFPFVHYAMFSDSFAQPDSLVVFEITVDGRRLQATDFPVARWDMVQEPLLAFDRQAGSRDFAFDKAKTQAGLQQVGLGSLYTRLKPNFDNDSSAGSRWPSWYAAYLGRLIRRPIGDLRVDKAWYRYADGHFFLLKKENRVSIRPEKT
jgi:hypothetical protein